MTVDWVSVAMALLGAIATVYLSKPSQPAPAPTTPTSSGGLFHGGLLQRLHGTVPSASPTVAVSSGHPVLDSILAALQAAVATNPQLQQIEGVVMQLVHPTGTVNLSLTKGGTANVSNQPVANPVVSVPAVVNTAVTASAGS